MTTIITIASIVAAAKAATLHHSDAESASPYAADSDAHAVFTEAFDNEREAQLRQIQHDSGYDETPITKAISTGAAIDIKSTFASMAIASI